MANMARTYPRYVSLETAAEQWGISARTLRRRISDGTITGYRVPGTRAVRVDLNELDRLMKPMR
ncbi:helix-turn-helix transcriptional regulator [Nocardia sp. NPDC127526]|uniref:helix-turn-helix transcriptional regulator n=1 Tax=Nocardia sp. NPDC127526 TaxID=3345393 RepID=UPI003645BEF2